VEANNAGQFPQLNGLLSINDLKQKLELLSTLFTPFKTAIDKLQGQLYVTGSEVMPQIAELRKLLQPVVGESEFLATAKSKLLQAFKACVFPE